MKKYIAYYRVSTKEQGNSNLGLSAQRQSVQQFTSDGQLIKEFQEVESGRKSNRPVLLKAIAEANKLKATLVIAKLDRLARNVEFVYALKNSGVDFICADMPDANSLTIGIMAVLAENEAKTTAERTKSALNVIQDKLSRGETHISKTGQIVTKLGGNHRITSEERNKGSEILKNKANNNQDNIKAFAFINALVEAGDNFKIITDKLNNAGFVTSRGGKFYAAQTKRVYERFK
jgi:DNA invertase Pin-like site-specific DNA recombinase